MIRLVACSIDASYDLVPPLSFTNVSEIGNWSLTGSTVNLKTSLRLSSPSFMDSGGACLRLPTFFRDWELEFEISAPSRGSILFSFTTIACPSPPFSPGFEILIVSNSSASPVFFANGSTPQELGRIRLPPRATLRLARQGDRLTFDSVRYHADERIFEIYVDGLLKHGYFAFTGSAESGDCDLFSVRVRPLSDYISADVDYSNINRRAIREAARRRSRAARAAEMPLAFGPIEGGAREGLHLLSELSGRLEQRFTREGLQLFVAGQVARLGEFALRKFELRAAEFVEAAAEVRQLHGTVRGSMVGMAKQVGLEMARLREEFTGMAISGRLAGVGRAQAELEGRAGAVRDPVTRALVGIAAVECICFVTFFYIRRRTTDGFKKRN